MFCFGPVVQLATWHKPLDFCLMVGSDATTDTNTAAGWPVRSKLEYIKAEGVTCIPIVDVRIMLTEHYNFIYQLIYEGR